MSRSPIDFGRALIDRIFPRGALILSVLSFVYFVMGVIRNRVFANTYGAGPELDAYNAAFRIPEIALDVLVAAGLTAPFVPIYSSLRRGDERCRERLRTDRADRRDPRDDRRRRRDLRRGPVAGHPDRCRLRRPDARAVRDARPDQLLRPDPVRCVDLSGRDPRREPALPVLRARADPVHERDHPRHRARRRTLRHRRDSLGRGRRCRAPPRDPGDRHAPDVVPHPTGVPHPDTGVPRVHPADDPAHDQPPHRARDLHVLHGPRVDDRGRRRERDQLRARLPGRAGQPDRHRVLAGGVPDALCGLRGSRPGDVPIRAGAQPCDDRRADDTRRDRALRRVEHPGRCPARRGRVRPRGRRAHVGDRFGLRAVGAVRRARLPAVTWPLRDA